VCSWRVDAGVDRVYEGLIAGHVGEKRPLNPGFAALVVVVMVNAGAGGWELLFLSVITSLTIYTIWS